SLEPIRRPPPHKDKAAVKRESEAVFWARMEREGCREEAEAWLEQKLAGGLDKPTAQAYLVEQFQPLDGSKNRAWTTDDEVEDQVPDLEGIYTTGGEVGHFVISTNLAPGTHKVSFPAPFKDINELLILAQSTAASGKFGSNLCLFIVGPASNTVEVVPQDWFNEGPFDYDYQFITRVARDPRTGKIF